MPSIETEQAFTDFARNVRNALLPLDAPIPWQDNFLTWFTMQKKEPPKREWLLI